MTAALLRPADWTRDALCADRLTPWHWDDHGTPEARAVCAECPVRLQCATEALQRAEPRGMWGGLDPDDRRDLAHHRGYELPGLPPHGTRSRFVHRTHACRPEQTGIPCPSSVTCRERHRRWAAERRAAGAWTRSTTPAQVAS